MTADEPAALGVRVGETVRFRRVDLRRWQTGRIAGLGPDGSILLHDRDGAARSVRPDNVEVRRPGPRGRLVWCNLAERSSADEQLELW